ncbi:MAG: hypothetical protein MUQ25_13730 [Candidatus Aminicenantes bacterium]|nr:hypothetical protein [Candidatus Aminicenantes bacterium]
MPALSPIRRLDDVEAALDLLKPLAQPPEVFSKIPDMEAANLPDIFRRQRQKISRFPASDHGQQSFKMITEPLFPALRTSPIPAAQLDPQRPATGTTQDYERMTIIGHFSALCFPEIKQKFTISERTS